MASTPRRTPLASHHQGVPPDRTCTALSRVSLSARSSFFLCFGCCTCFLCILFPTFVFWVLIEPARGLSLRLSQRYLTLRHQSQKSGPLYSFQLICRVRNSRYVTLTSFQPPCLPFHPFGEPSGEHNVLDQRCSNSLATNTYQICLMVRIGRANDCIVSRSHIKGRQVKNVQEII